MTESATAEIIPFRSRPAEPATANSTTLSQVEPTPAETRLSRALLNLNDALTVQHAAIAAWKSSLGELSMATGRLGASLRSYNDSLGQLDERVATLHTEAVKLEAWADDALARKG